MKFIFDWLAVLITISNLTDREMPFFPDQTCMSIFIIDSGEDKQILTVEPFYFLSLVVDMYIFVFSFTVWRSSDSLASPI